MNKFLRFSLMGLLLLMAGAVNAQEAVEATCADVINGEDGTVYRVTGNCASITNTKYGNWWLKDQTGEVYIYGTQDADGNWNFAELGIEAGDIVTVEGPKTTYNTTVELVNVQVVNIVKSPVKVLSMVPTSGVIEARGGSFQVTVAHSVTPLDIITPDVNWLTIENRDYNADEGYTIVTFNLAANEEEARQATIVFEVEKDGQTFSVETTIKQEASANVPGTVNNPFTVAQAIAKCLEIGSTSDGELYYAKGIISSIREVSVQYGNATFSISDDGTDEGSLLCYRSLSLNNQKFTDEDEIAVGDVVVIVGKLVNYKGETPEFSGNVYIYSLNESAPAGTLDNPFTPAEANAFCRSLSTTPTTTDYYVKGKIVSYANNGEFGTQYGNATFYISEDGSADSETFYVWRTLYLGNVKYADDSWLKPVPGDEVIICGKLTMYKDTPETATNQSYIYSLNGVTSGVAGVQQTATADKTYYDLSGRRVVNPAKGVYIVDGKKIVLP